MPGHDYCAVVGCPNARHMEDMHIIKDHVGILDGTVLVMKIKNPGKGKLTVETLKLLHQQLSVQTILQQATITEILVEYLLST